MLEKASGHLELREDPEQGVIVAGLRCIKVRTWPCSCIWFDYLWIIVKLFFFFFFCCNFVKKKFGSSFESLSSTNLRSILALDEQVRSMGWIFTHPFLFSLQIQVQSADKILELLNLGNSRRKTESTEANATSSR